MRKCCSANSREFNMRIKHVKNDNYLDENYSAPYLHIRKTFKCRATFCYCCCCCCLDSPEMLINFCSTHRALGRIKTPITYFFCDPKFYIYDGTGNQRYIIRADCCQCGLCCANNIFGKLSEVYFNIYSFNNMTNPCGQIIKKSATVIELSTSADSFQVIFPKDASPEDKMLLVIAALMIDYQYFEESTSSSIKKFVNNYHYRNY